MTRTLVMKFGGAAVASPEQFSKIATLILNRRQEYQRLVVVVSAMGDTTDDLIALAKQVNPEPPQREYDMLLTVGERISISLLAMALAAQKHQAISFTGSQSGIITCARHANARIIDVRPARILRQLDQERTVIVAGFQGVSEGGEITTLGRGGSDTSAVALGVALQAEKIEFYKDVAGIYDSDPKTHADATLYEQLSYQEALQIADRGAQVLHPRAIELARKNGIMLQVRCFENSNCTDFKGTWIRESEGGFPERPVYELELLPALSASKESND